MILKTARLTLRPQIQADAPALFSILNDPEAMRFWNRGAITRLAVAEELVAGQQAAMEAGGCRYWTVLEGPDAIGSVDLSLIESQSAELGFLLRRDRWGLGLASEAAAAVADFGLSDQGGLARLAAAALAGNLAARRVLEKAGFRLAETRNARLADGRGGPCAFYLRDKA
ncbi:MAG TPA: GNAT family N-acetyltransferase [Rhizomicrobium sp.]|jgi:RimJ/RimL family protein N-acetyltransferase|nr:GNAT family N-acetyltransferase [Rhizomicrobium sp.]